MANRYLRGTFTRNAWDFYEVGCAFAYGTYNAPAGKYGFVFRNNGIAQSYIDIFRAEATSGVTSQLVWSIIRPGVSFTSIEPSLYFNSPIQMDLAQPPGDMAVYQSPPDYFSPVLKNRLDLVEYDFIELANGGPFLTLPPLYGLAVGFVLGSPSYIAATVWYQSITDHTPPAT